MTAKSKRRLGLSLIIASVAVLLWLLPAYAIASFIVAQIAVVNESTNFSVIGSAINVLLGLSGILALVGIPVGAVVMSRAGLDLKAGEHLKEEPGFGHLSNEHAAFLTQWSLGAFLNPVVWALGNKLWPWAIGLLAPMVIFPILGPLLPLIGIISVILISLVIVGWSFFATVFLIVRGRRLAWKRGWQSFEQFPKHQRFMLRLILILDAVAIVISAVIGAILLRRRGSQTIRHPSPMNRSRRVSVLGTKTRTMTILLLQMKRNLILIRIMRIRMGMAMMTSWN
jgi:hypothetical protein